MQKITAPSLLVEVEEPLLLMENRMRRAAALNRFDLGQYKRPFAFIGEFDVFFFQDRHEGFCITDVGEGLIDAEIKVSVDGIDLHRKCIFERNGKEIEGVDVFFDRAEIFLSDVTEGKGVIWLRATHDAGSVIYRSGGL